MLREMMLGAVLCLVVLGPLGLACGNSALVQCKLDALRVLPDDPMQATAYDAVDLIERLKTCHRGQSDGGS